MKCKRCKVDKELPEKGRCAGCNEYVKNYYQENKTQEITRAKKNNNKKSRAEINKYKKALNRKNTLSIILQQAKRRAKLKNLPFDITASDLTIPDICPVLGIPLCVNSGHAKDNSISLDRIVPELGYVKGNVEIISYKANTIKNNASVEDLEKVLSWLKNKLK
jgi:hypothetical protein